MDNIVLFYTKSVKVHEILDTKQTAIDVYTTVNVLILKLRIKKINP